ncbi:MAG: hypothetical protein ACK5MN_13455 [Lachnospiraceae bacterium]
MKIQEYQSRMEEIANQDFTASVKSGRRVDAFIKDSCLNEVHQCVATLQLPKIFTRHETAAFRKIVKTTYGIMEKVVQQYIADREYRTLFPFSKELEQLICTPSGYTTSVPIARLDIFYNEEDGSFKFCEINTDGTSAMIDNEVLEEALQYNNVVQKLREEEQFNTFSLFESWVIEVGRIYETYEKKVENPHVAIVDFLDRGHLQDFDAFMGHFQKYGYTAEVCDIRQMKYEGGSLYSQQTGRKIDIIYRRAVTADIMDRFGEVQDFIQAALHTDVCLLGSFRTQLAHHKAFFMALHDARTLQILTPQEQQFVREHVPRTYVLDSYYKEHDIVSDRAQWIIKPMDSYGSRGVYAGIDYEAQQWQEVLDKSVGEGYLIQEYCPPYRTPNVYMMKAEPRWKMYANMTGLFTYNGRFSGIYSRLSDGAVISSVYNEETVASLVANGN